MKLFLVSQTENQDYDTYDSFVVAAEDENEARNTIPDSSEWKKDSKKGWYRSTWCSAPELASVEYLGEAAEGVKGIICASFNAG